MTTAGWNVKASLYIALLSVANLNIVPEHTEFCRGLFRLVWEQTRPISLYFISPLTPTTDCLRVGGGLVVIRCVVS